MRNAGWDGECVCVCVGEMGVLRRQSLADQQPISSQSEQQMRTAVYMRGWAFCAEVFCVMCAQAQRGASHHLAR